MWYPVKQWILLLYLQNQIWSWYHYAEKLANAWVGGLVYTQRLACGLKHLGHFEPLVHAFKQKDNEQLVLIAYFIVAAVSKLNSLSFSFPIMFARLVKVLFVDWAFIITRSIHGQTNGHFNVNSCNHDKIFWSMTICFNFYFLCIYHYSSFKRKKIFIVQIYVLMVMFLIKYFATWHDPKVFTMNVSNFLSKYYKFFLRNNWS